MRRRHQRGSRDAGCGRGSVFGWNISPFLLGTALPTIFLVNKLVLLAGRNKPFPEQEIPPNNPVFRASPTNIVECYLRLRRFVGFFSCSFLQACPLSPRLHPLTGASFAVVRSGCNLKLVPPGAWRCEGAASVLVGHRSGRIDTGGAYVAASQAATQAGHLGDP